jgi:hypothetical protein
MSLLDQLYSAKELAALDRKHRATLQRLAHRLYRSAAIRKIAKAGNPNVRKRLRPKLRAVYSQLKRRRRKK